MHYRAAVIAGLQAGALYLSAFIIPVIGQALALLTPVPLIIAFIRNGKTAGISALFIAVTLSVAIAGWHVGVLLPFTFGLMAAGASEGMRRRWRPESAVLLSGLLPVAAGSILAGFYLHYAGKNPVTALEAYLRGSLSEAARLYAELGLSEMSAAVNAASNTFIQYFVRLVPGIVIAMSLVQAACCYSLARIIMTRKTGKEPGGLQVAGFSTWHAPDIWIWGLIAALVLVILPYGPSHFAGLNLVIVYSVIYLIQGIALVEHFLKRARIRPIARGVIHAVILALPTVVFVIALGVVDVWGDFRKVRSGISPS